MQKNVEQFDDILRNFINETNMYDGRCGKIGDEVKTLAVRRLMMPDSLLNYRLRGTKLPYEELLIALENNSIDKVMTHSASKVKKIDERTHVGMTAGTDGEGNIRRRFGKHQKLQCKQCTRAQEAKVDGTEGKDPSLTVQKYFDSGKGEEGANRA